jgi:hypothetical protein
MDAVIIVEDGTATCRKLRDVRAAIRSSAATTASASCPSSASATARLRVHDQRDLVGAAGRGQHRQDRGDDARHQARRRQDRVRDGPVAVHTGGTAYFSDIVRKGFVSAVLSGNALAVTTSSTRCSAPRSASTSKPARR